MLSHVRSDSGIRVHITTTNGGAADFVLIHDARPMYVEVATREGAPSIIIDGLRVETFKEVA